MRQRCGNPNHPLYQRYGGRGIAVCRRRDSFTAFMHDMGERPGHRHSIDRIDNDGNYEPSNCRWATHKQQHEDLRGEAHWNARLTEADVVEIRRLRADGAPRTEVAAIYGVHPHHVTAITAGRAWGHVP